MNKRKNIYSTSEVARLSRDQLPYVRPIHKAKRCREFRFLLGLIMEGIVLASYQGFVTIDQMRTMPSNISSTVTIAGDRSYSSLTFSLRQLSPTIIIHHSSGYLFRSCTVLFPSLMELNPTSYENIADSSKISPASDPFCQFLFYTTSLPCTSTVLLYHKSAPPNANAKRHYCIIGLPAKNSQIGKGRPRSSLDSMSYCLW